MSGNEQPEAAFILNSPKCWKLRLSSIPNGLGLDYLDEHGNITTIGAAQNELTATDLADKFVGTPWHKSVPVRVEATG